MTAIVGDSACRSCRAPIRWARTVTGRAIPLNAEPDADGNVELVDGVASLWLWRDGAVRYMPHHATCPTVDQHRRPG